MKLRASIVAAVLVVTGAVFGAATPAAASTGYCASPSTQGHAATITMGGKLVATLRLKYCSSIRMTYGEFTIDATWKKTHSGYNAQIDVCTTGIAGCYVGGPQWFNEKVNTVLLSRDVSIDGSGGNKQWYAQVALFEYGSCTTYDLPWTDTHDYSTGQNLGGIANRVC